MVEASKATVLLPGGSSISEDRSSRLSLLFDADKGAASRQTEEDRRLSLEMSSVVSSVARLPEAGRIVLGSGGRRRRPCPRLRSSRLS
jgi:hypothetical protein